MKRFFILIVFLGCRNIRLENIKFKDRGQTLKKAFNIIKDNKIININNFSEMIEELKKESDESINLNSLDENGKTLLHYAAERVNKDIIYTF